MNTHARRSHAVGGVALIGVRCLTRHPIAEAPMRVVVPSLMLFAWLIASIATFAADPVSPFPSFRAEEVDKSLKIGYAVKLVDINADGKPDIVVVDKHRVIWFENPTWKLHTILEGTTKADNVCLDVLDIDGDGKLDIALGAGWTTPMGTIQWLKQPANIDEPWKVYPIAEEPSVHRMRFVDFEDGHKRLLVAPLQGKGATAKGNWMEHGPRLVLYEVPKDPTTEPWKPTLITDQLHVVHNFAPIGRWENSFNAVLFASYEGLTVCRQLRPDGRWEIEGRWAEGNQDHPESNRGCSEVKFGKLKNGGGFITTIEPWHGNQVVVYLHRPNVEALERHVIDTELKWGHGLWCCDLDGDGNDEIVVGVRDPLNEKVRSGVNVFKATDQTGTKWEKHVIDNGGVAVEDLACADLNADGRIDIVAVGRATGNVKIYWNEAPKPAK
jgi:hypothetical protein